jgi:hypothetical protein
MSRLKSFRLGTGSALWLWSLAIGVATPTIAADFGGPMLIDASSEVAPATEEQIREARRLLIDLPGADPIANAAGEMLLFGPAEEPTSADEEECSGPSETVTMEVDELTLDDLSLQAKPTKSVSDARPHGGTITAATPMPTILAPAKSRPESKSTIPLDQGPLDRGSQDSVDPATDDAQQIQQQAANLSPEMLQLCDKVRTVLARYYPRHQNARDNTPWEVMHAIIAYGVDTQIYKDGPGSDKVNAIGYMCYNYPLHDQRILGVNRGKLDASRGVGLQGHGGQFLAILAQSHVKSDFPLRVEGKNFTLQNLIEREMETCVAGEELTFKLIALMHYLDPDATWTTPDGEKWSIERLVREELKAPIRGAACGGTHRLMGYSYAVNKRIQRGKPITGDYKRAQKYLQDYHRYTFSLQNPDGSFSTAWFERKANEQSIDRKLKTSGHILEWITFSLSDDELRDPRMTKAVDFVASLMLNNDKHTWEIGPQGHALHALLMYEGRVFKNVVPLKQAPLADGTSAVIPLEARREEVK